MARPKKQVKLKEPIKIRLKSLADGNKSIYLDIYYKGVRKYEYLKLYLVPEINPVCKEQNKQTMAVAERIKAERIKALHGHGIQDWETVKQGSMLLTTWIKKYCEGGVGIKKSTLHCRVEMMHTVEKYLDETNKGFISLEEVNAEFCRGYVKFLRNFIRTHISLFECIISQDFSGVIAKLFNQRATILHSRRVYFSFNSSRFAWAAERLLSKALHRCALFLPALRMRVFGSMICKNPVFLYHK